jgi:hypothetical protein
MAQISPGIYPQALVIFREMQESDTFGRTVKAAIRCNYEPICLIQVKAR